MYCCNRVQSVGPLRGESPTVPCPPPKSCPQNEEYSFKRHYITKADYLQEGKKAAAQVNCVGDCEKVQ